MTDASFGDIALGLVLYTVLSVAVLVSIDTLLDTLYAAKVSNVAATTVLLLTLDITTS